MPPRKRAPKGKGASRKSDESTVSRWSTFISGMLLGAVLTIGGMYIYASGMKMNLGEGIKNLVKSHTGSAEKTVSKETQKTSDPKPVFDFYTVLPEYETVVDEKQFIHDVKKPAKKQEKDATYILRGAHNLPDRLSRICPVSEGFS